MFMNELQIWENEEPIRKPKKDPKWTVVGRRAQRDKFYTPPPP